MMYTKGVEVRTGVSIMTISLGVGVRLGVAVRYGLSGWLDIFCTGADAQAVMRNT